MNGYSKRNLIQKATQDARKLLEDEFGRQLEGTFDILRDGNVAPEPGEHLGPEQRIVRRKIVTAIEHEEAGGISKKEAVGAYLRETAFTFLNRFAALKMVEAQGLSLECVSKAQQSSGFKEFCGLAPGLSELQDKGYRIYIESLFDELSNEIKVLFDRRNPASLLWPPQKVLDELLDILNRDEIKDAWGEDETIGWVYQYFNSADERKKMREQSAAPRNSRELAVRNQFFTPRYVVEFLTDNTLGRIWYEMTQGNTSLKEHCRYLVRRPDEVFLDESGERVLDWLRGQPSENEPQIVDIAQSVNGYLRAGGLHEGAEDWFNKKLEKIRSDGPELLSTQELLDFLFVLHRADRFCEGMVEEHDAEMQKLMDVLRERIARSQKDYLTAEEPIGLPEFIPLRRLKDPRDIKILDPACGSGHFLLYAFDLLEKIYAEAWDAEDDVSIRREDRSPWLKPLREVFSEKGEFLREVPNLIIEYNLHGIDIDHRAAQIATLALWMRAQRSWKGLDLNSARRPRITKSNIVAAEPMPGEKEMLLEFRKTLHPSLLGQFVEDVFEKMDLAGEAGSLLKIEVEIRDAISRARKHKQAGPRRQLGLFDQGTTPVQGKIDFENLSHIKDEEFWNGAEERIYEALKRYSKKAVNGKAFQRRLFVNDTERGFAFIDLCRKRYDVVLMNPPFGDASLPSKPYIDEVFGDTKGDVYKAFVECFQSRLVPGGMLGIISSRTGFFLSQSTDWRQRVVLRLYRPVVMADLGHGVLDAMVETAAYVLRSLNKKEKEELILSLVPLLEKAPKDTHNCFSIPKYQRVRSELKRHHAIEELEQMADEGYLEEIPGRYRKFRPVWDKIKNASPPIEKTMPVMTCFRTIESPKKGSTLLKQVGDLSNANHVYTVRPDSFESVPNAPFSYWIQDSIRELFFSLPIAQSEDRRITLGLSTKNDTRFVRLWWEIESNFLGRDKKWANYANGGTFSPFYFNHSAVVLSERNCSELRAYLVMKFPYLSGNASWILHEENDYRSPVVAWPLRTHAFSPAFLPEDFFFSARTYAAVIPREKISIYLGLFASRVVDLLLKVSLGRTGHPEFVTGVIRSLPIPRDIEREDRLGKLATEAWRIKKRLGTAELTSHDALVPALLISDGDSLSSRSVSWTKQIDDTNRRLTGIRGEIDELAMKLYCIDEKDFGLSGFQNSYSEFKDCLNKSLDDVGLVLELIDYQVGISFGRWDIRFAARATCFIVADDPLAPLPVCPPGILKGPGGLPAKSEDVPEEYPVKICWDGILVDDPGFAGGQQHENDIVVHNREVFGILWGERALGIEEEACDILGIPHLRDHFRKTFFKDHIKRYSKNRRKAPIYWQLSTPSSSYSVWLYYIRITKDLFYRLLNEFVEPKLRFEEQELEEARQQYGTSPSAVQRKEISAREAFVAELADFKEEIARIAPLWNPDLNDGVIINFAPLWRLVPQNKPWQKECKKTWDKLVKGEYDWAHLAMHLWPERVVPKCVKDRSLAIAHGLDETFWDEDDNGKSKSKKVPKEAVESLIKERTSPTVKAALDNLLKAPVPAGMGDKKRKKRT